VSRNILRELDELVEAEVIGLDEANRIREYYKNQQTDPSGRQTTIFGIIGSLLVGLGLILLIAHNWDNLGKTLQTIIAFAPLVISQIIGFWFLNKKSDKSGMLEGISVFIFLSVGACLSLVSQIYHIQGSVSDFLRTWLFLGIPLVYIFRSGSTALLYLILATYYAVDSGYFKGSESWLYWVFLALVIPYYIHLFTKKHNENITSVLNWIIPISLTISLGIISDGKEEIVIWAYILMFSCFYLFGLSDRFKKLINNGWKIIGAIGMMALLLVTSFEWYWQAIEKLSAGNSSLFSTNEFFYVCILIFLSIFFLFIWSGNKVSFLKDPMRYIFAVFSLLFLLGMANQVLPLILTNVLILGISILYIINGIKENHLGLMNFGLLVFAALVGCRYFDLNLSFTQRGLLFVFVGCGFFASNMWMLRKRKERSNG